MHPPKLKYTHRTTTIGNHNPNPTMNIRTLTLAFVFLLPIAASVSPTPSPSPSRFPPKQTMSGPNGQLHRHTPPEGSVRHHPPPATCSSVNMDCFKRRLHRPPPPADERSRDSGRKIGIAFVGVAILLQVVLGGFLVFKRIQLKKGFRSLPSTSTS